MWYLIRYFSDHGWHIYLESLYFPKISHEDLVYLKFLIDKFFSKQSLLTTLPQNFVHLLRPLGLKPNIPILSHAWHQKKNKKQKSSRKNIQSMAKQHQMFMVLSYFMVNLLEHKTPNCITSQKRALKEFNAIKQEILLLKIMT